MRRRYPLDQSPLYALRTKRALSELLKLDLPELRRIARTEQLYKEWDIPKRSGGSRHIENPHRSLKIVQARIARLLARIEPPDFLFCPVKGRSYVGNAARHLGSRVVKCVDIREYFPTTGAHRVFWFFRQVMKCEPDVAFMLTEIATYKGRLPTGSPLSPIMSFFAHYDMWRRVAAVAAQNNLVLTVYIDDVTLSGSHVPEKTLWVIKKIIHASGLRYHKQKRYIGRPADITGIIVDKDGLKLARRAHKKFFETRAELRIALLAGDSQREKAARARLTGLHGQSRQLDQLGS